MKHERLPLGIEFTNELDRYMETPISGKESNPTLNAATEHNKARS